MKTLKELKSVLDIKELHCIKEDIAITTIEVDSRQVQEGSLFVCIRGDHADGHHYVTQAIKAGAVAIVCDLYLPIEIPQFVVENTKQAIKQIAAWFYDYPSSKLKMIGITGTNGKTTTAYLVHHILTNNHYKCGMMGTVVIDNGCDVIESHLTTPQPAELQYHLRSFIDNGCSHAVMEVSSHSLSFGRVDQVDFDIAGFTNLSQDHLDYHITMENYRSTKGLLFARCPEGAVINFDDGAGAYMASQAVGPVMGYSTHKPLPDGLFASDIQMSATQTQFNLQYQGQTYAIESHLIGLFNIYNTLLAFGLSLKCGLTVEQITQAIRTFKPVAGRFMTVPFDADFTAIVDYAHSPDALENVLRTARRITAGKLIVVFGCGGDRDRTKRPIMGRIADQNADLVIVTSDNPRSEDQNQIVRDVLSGIPKKDHTYVEVDRSLAIKLALKLAVKGDVILIAGKGHETYQILNDRVIDFNDSEVVQQLWKEMTEHANS